jgi:hypothetical protein
MLLPKSQAFKRQHGLTNNPCAAFFPRRLRDLRLSIEEGDKAFEFQNSTVEVLNGRPALVVEAFPKSTVPELANDLVNFRLRVWIDSEDLEIARVEATAIREGVDPSSFCVGGRVFRVQKVSSRNADILSRITLEPRGSHSSLRNFAIVQKY